MAFTYVGDLSTDLDVVRFNSGDTVENAGPRPDKRNFSDAEDGAVITAEGHTTAATARIFEVLGSEWASYALVEKEGEVSFDAKEVVDKFAALAAEWRSKPDGGDSSRILQAGVITLDFMEKGSTT